MPLPPLVQEHLTAAAQEELRRILAGRAQLRTLSELACATGCRPVLLKGGAFLNIEERSYDLDDLDVLLPSYAALEYLSAIDAAGYQAHVGFSSSRHLSARSAHGSLNVEVHVIDNRDQSWTGAAAPEALPIPELPGLARLPPREHAWHILKHVTLDHLNRRGRIRDLLLLADAVVDCSSDDLGRLSDRMVRHPAGGVMQSQLAMASMMARGIAPVDEFAGVALTNHVLHVRMHRATELPGNLQVTIFNMVFAILGGPIERRLIWTRETAIPLEPSRFSFIGWLQRRAPRLGRLWLLCFRLVRFPIALSLAAPHARAARRALRQAGLAPRLG